LNSHTHCFINDQATKRVMLHGTLTNGFYAIQSSPQHQLFQVSTQSSNTWHSRLVHYSSIISSLCKNKYITASSLEFSFCTDGNKEKSHNFSFSLSTLHVVQPLQVIHTDLWGPSLVPSNNGHKYFVHFIDEYSRFS
jgi:hypothetical protein